MLRVTLFTRQDCSLCDKAKEDLEAIQKDIPYELHIVDIDTDQDIKKSYGDRVPVVEVGPYKAEAPFDRKKLRMIIGAGRDRADQKEEYGGKSHKLRTKRGKSVSKGDQAVYWFSRHYMAVLNTLIFLYVGLPFLAPVLMQAGMTGLARPIYSVYGAVCHQMAFRSWFLFGEQEVYPREAANVEGFITYGEATGLSEEDLLGARRFIGNEQVGYKIAYCQRDVAIYAAMLLFGLIYAISGKRIPAIAWYLWIIIGMGPIAVDGFSQLFSQIPNFPFWDYRESTPFLRTLTGALFGFMTAWFGFPLVKEAMDDTRLMLASKMARVK